MMFAWYFYFALFGTSHHVYVDYDPVSQSSFKRYIYNKVFLNATYINMLEKYAPWPNSDDLENFKLKVIAFLKHFRFAIS